VPRPPRKPRPPGVVHVVCTGRGEHSTVRFLPDVQLWEDDQGRLRIKWDTRQGQGPVTGFYDTDGLQTYDKKCGTCGRHFKRREDKFGAIAMALAELQGITDNSSKPIILDISRIERV